MGLPGRAFVRWWQAGPTIHGAHGSVIELVMATLFLGALPAAFRRLRPSLAWYLAACIAVPLCSTLWSFGRIASTFFPIYLLAGMVWADDRSALQRLWVTFGGIAAAGIILVVAKTGWDLLRDAMSVLLDASLDRATLDRIETTILDDPAVTELRWLTGRNAGRFRFVEAGVALRVTDLGRAAVAVERVEAAVRSSIPHIDRVLIHVEVPSAAHVRYAVPLSEPPDRVSPHFGAAPLFALLDVGRANGQVLERRTVANPHSELAKGKGIRVAEWLVSHRVDIVLSRESLRGKGPAHVLSEAGIELHETSEALVAGALTAYLSDTER